MDLNINDLNSSNFLAVGGLLQTASDQFILLLGARTPVFSANAESSHQVFVYSPQFWEFLDTKSERILGLFQVEKTVKVTRQELIRFLEKNIVKTATSLNLVESHKADFEAQFHWSQKSFADGVLQKTVPATKFEFATEEKFNFANQLYLSLQKSRPGYIYGL